MGNISVAELVKVNDLVKIRGFAGIGKVREITKNDKFSADFMTGDFRMEHNPGLIPLSEIQKIIY